MAFSVVFYSFFRLFVFWSALVCRVCRGRACRAYRFGQVPRLPLQRREAENNVLSEILFPNKRIIMVVSIDRRYNAADRRLGREGLGSGGSSGRAHQ